MTDSTGAIEDLNASGIEAAAEAITPGLSDPARAKEAAVQCITAYRRASTPPVGDVERMAEDGDFCLALIAYGAAYRKGGDVSAECREVARAALSAVPQPGVPEGWQAVTDVRAFHAACDVPVLDSPQVPSAERVALRREILREEWRETDAAMECGDLLEVADGLADIIYVTIGAALEFGIPLESVWAEVQRTNMAKIDPATGKVRKRDDGKVLKPNGWTPPDIKAALSTAPPPPALPCQLEPRVPEGFWLAPDDPTEEMFQAAERVWDGRMSARSAGVWHAMKATAPPPPVLVGGLAPVIGEIAAERRRQIEAEGWSVEHDDEHVDGSLATAAACYAAPECVVLHPPRRERSWPTQLVWPESWSRKWWKPKDARRNLIRAAALLVAEIERLDRAASPSSPVEEAGT